jgi:hypothetical protein
MIVDTISIVFESELSPDYAEVIRGVAHRHGLTVADVRLTEDEVDIDLEFAGDDATMSRKAVQEFKSRVPAALSVARVQVLRGGDTYVASQVAAQGRGAVAHDNVMVQHVSSPVDVEPLLAELQGLLAWLKRGEKATEDAEEATAALVLAKSAVKAGNLSRAWGYVGSFAKSLLPEAQKAGFTVLAAWLKEKLGLHG